MENDGEFYETLRRMGIKSAVSASDSYIQTVMIGSLNSSFRNLIFIPKQLNGKVEDRFWAKMYDDFLAINESMQSYTHLSVDKRFRKADNNLSLGNSQQLRQDIEQIVKETGEHLDKIIYTILPDKTGMQESENEGLYNDVEDWIKIFEKYENERSKALKLSKTSHTTNQPPTGDELIDGSRVAQPSAPRGTTSIPGSLEELLGIPPEMVRDAKNRIQDDLKVQDDLEEVPNIFDLV